MLDIINNAIDKFYKEKDHALLKELCTKQILLFKELIKYVNKHRFKIEETSCFQMFPSVEWTIHLNDYKNDELEISYKTVLKVSKIIPLYYAQHEFSIKNIDENGLVPYLTGINNITCTKEQFYLNEKIKAVLKKKGYISLDYRDMIEAVPGFKMPENLIQKYGPNVTVEHLLFMDIFDICSK